MFAFTVFFLIFIIGIIGVLIGVRYLLANECYKIACAKGYWQRKYFWITFFIRDVGLLMVIALPDRSKEQQ